MVVNVQVFVSLGQDLLNRSGKIVSSSDGLRFRATFGTSPENCAKVWQKIDEQDSLPDGGKPKHLLWALMLLKLYCSEMVLSSMAGGVHQETFRKWAWTFVDLIAFLQYRVILWENRFKNNIGNVCLVSVDGTDFRIYQWKPFWKGWYSHKFKGPGVRYEVGVCIRSGDIVWIHGPFPCGRWPDIKIFRNALIKKIPHGEKVEADGGYRGEPQKIEIPSGKHDMKQRVRSRHETVNKRFKQWQILNRVFRHEVWKHQSVFGAVAVLTQLAIENNEPLFPVDYRDETKYDVKAK